MLSRTLVKMLVGRRIGIKSRSFCKSTSLKVRDTPFPEKGHKKLYQKERQRKHKIINDRERVAESAALASAFDCFCSTLPLQAFMKAH